MKTLHNGLGYEPVRAWALSPSAVRPPGLAHILCGGLITWLSRVPPLSTPSAARLPVSTFPDTSTPLSTLVAAMIAEVLI